MEAKDTVVITPDHSESVYCCHCGEEQGIEGLVRMVREDQAEISFKAGYDKRDTEIADGKWIKMLYDAKQLGIREVVEWINENASLEEYKDGGKWRIDGKLIDWGMWLAKLKEWGGKFTPSV